MTLDGKYTRIMNGSDGVMGMKAFDFRKFIYWTDSARNENTTYTTWQGNRWSVRVSATIRQAAAKK